MKSLSRTLRSGISWARLKISAAALSSVLLATTGNLSFAQQPTAVKIGVLDDLSGPYSMVSGQGTVEAAKLAIEDYGAKALGQPIQVLIATDQNKPMSP